MKNTVSLGFKASIVCEHCRNEVPIGGFFSSVRCPFCQRVSDLSKNFWSSFDTDEQLRALEFVEVDGGADLLRVSNPQIQINYAKLLARCQYCKTVVALSSLQEGFIVCSCHKRLKVRRADDLVRKSIPQAQWIFHETTAEEGAFAEPVLFACLACGNGIEATSKEQIIKCASCKKNNLLPDALWRHFNPIVGVSLFFVICEFQHKPQLELQAQHPDPQKRRSIARQKLPEIFQRLVEDNDTDVLMALAENPHLPSHLLERLIKRDKQEVLYRLVERPSTTLYLLEAIVHHSTFLLQSKARSHPNYKVTELTAEHMTNIPESKTYTEAELQKLTQEALREAEKQSEGTIEPKAAPIIHFQELPPDADPYRAMPAAIEEPTQPQTPEAPTEEAIDTWRQTFLRWIRSKPQE